MSGQRCGQCCWRVRVARPVTGDVRRFDPPRLVLLEYEGALMARMPSQLKPGGRTGAAVGITPDRRQVYTGRTYRLRVHGGLLDFSHQDVRPTDGNAVHHRRSTLHTRRAPIAAFGSSRCGAAIEVADDSLQP